MIKVFFVKYPIYVGANRGRGQVYPTGEKTNNNLFTSIANGKIQEIKQTEKNSEISILSLTEYSKRTNMSYSSNNKSSYDDFNLSENNLDASIGKLSFISYISLCIYVSNVLTTYLSLRYTTTRKMYPYCDLFTNNLKQLTNRLFIKLESSPCSTASFAR